MFKIAPSILSANFARLEDEIKKVEVDGVQYIHIDVMDGHFVPNITIGALVVRDIKKVSSIPLDVHLMIEEPERYIDDFARAGADIITFHVEATNHPEKLLKHIRSLGIKSGISIKPATDLDSVRYFYGAMDLILIMTVDPGFGGQKLIPFTLDKVRKLKEIKDRGEFDFIIEVDGGVMEENIRQYVEAGAELIVAGNAIFSGGNPSEAVERLLEKGGR